MNKEDGKTCTKCQEVKTFDNFAKNRTAQDGLAYTCRECQSIAVKKTPAYRFKRVWQELRRDWKRTPEYKEFALAKHAEQKEKNRKPLGVLRDQATAWRKANPEKVAQKKREYSARKKSCPLHAIKMRCRSRIGDAFRANGFKKGAHTAELLGCTWEQLKTHLENQFSEGMTWANRKHWHIDHIIPYASADTAEDIVRLSHYTNLQPLWAVENMRKGSKMPQEL